MTGNAEYRDRFDAAFMTTYGTPPLALVRGTGAVVVDADGREYLDFVAGIAVSVLGHAHPAVVEAVSRQVRTLCHTSNLVVNPPAVALAERLVGLVGPGARVFLCNSGAEATETALKVARRHTAGRPATVAVEGGFHGRTAGALALTGQPGKRAPFEPLVPGVRFVPFGDAEALRAAVTEEVAAVFVEPVLGEAGVIPTPPGYLQAAREACDRTGALLVFDEVQGGIGRAGAWFSHQVLAPGVRPDVITLAKGLGGGLPIGACLAVGPAATALRPGDHGSTFGGNPVSCAAALAVLDTVRSEGLLERSTEYGQRLAGAIQALGHPLVDHVRGLGLWRAVELRAPVSAEVERAGRQTGLLVNAVSPTALRLAPPLVISAEECDEAVRRLAAALDAVPATIVGAGEPTGSR
ncbi:MAG TPA: acetylornithine transaminase [Mycobacteriales bacterium]|nr:acetylornithine transaminase [Mycobacteriales bacterium]